MFETFKKVSVKFNDLKKIEFRYSKSAVELF